MTVDQVIDTLKLEKQQRVPSRFPCRAIMVGNIAEYCDLLEKLKTIPNVEVVQNRRMLECHPPVFQSHYLQHLALLARHLEVN